MSLSEHNEYDEYTPLSTNDILDNTVSSESSDDSLIAVTQPEDRYNFVQITFAILGLAQLLPYNFLITATDYWMYKFRDVNQTNVDNTDKTELQKFFDSYLTIASNFPLLVVLLLNAFYGYKVREEIRNILSFSGIIIFFIITTVLVKTNTDSYQIKFFYLTMFCVVTISAFAALLQGSISGLVSVFPSRCMHAMVTGQGMAGIFAVFTQLLTIVWQWDATDSAFLYFLFADFVLIVTFAMYCLIYKTKYYKYYKERAGFSRRQQIDARPINDGYSRFNISYIVVNIWQHGMSVLLVFWVTIALFPPITVLIEPQNKNMALISSKYFLPVVCFLLFNLSDFLSRLIARFLPLPQNRRYLLLSLALLRFILIPLIMLCNIHPRYHLPVIFNSEVYYILFIILLGLSNGYVFGNAMINGPMRVSDQYKESAGFILVAFLGVGLTLGAFSSNLLIRLL